MRKGEGEILDAPLCDSLSPSFHKYLSAYNKLENVLGTAEMLQIRQQCPILLELIFLGERQFKK